MRDWCLIAEQTSGAAGLIPVWLAIITGSVTIITTLIKTRTPETMRPQTNQDAVRKSDPLAPDAGPGVALSQPKTGVLPPWPWALNVLLMVCGVALVGWGGYSLFEIHQLKASIAEKEKQLQDLNLTLVQASGVTFKPVVVRSEHKPHNDIRQYHIWVEAKPEILEQIDNVKYVFVDPDWHGPSVLMESDANMDGRKHFRCEINSREALLYITVIVAYKGYKENGAIQPINFHWRHDAQPAE
jgi:hypothetical protein